MLQTEAHDLFRRLLEDVERLVLTTHVNPDGDGIGSEIALARFLGERGKRVRIVNGDATPETLGFVEQPEGRIEVYDPGRHDKLIEEAELIVLVDNSAPDRLGRMEATMMAAAARTLCIDHHPARDAPWAHNIVDVESCATAAMIFELTRAAGWEPDFEAAQAIYVGLATDTGFFRFNSTNAEAHRVAAEVLRIGVEPAHAYQQVYERNTAAYTRLLGHALTGLTVSAGGAVASVELRRELISSLEAEEVDSGEITTPLLAMDGVRVAILFRELPGGRIKVSLRSKGDLDVHRLATEFGGGGHRNASGIVSDGPMDRVVAAVTERAAALLVQHSA